MSDPLTNITAKLLDKSIPWHTAAGWVVVLVLFWRYLAYDIINAVITLQGNHPLPPLQPFSVVDAVALAGIPVIGFFTQKA